MKSVEPGSAAYGNALWEIKRAEEELVELNETVSVLKINTKGGDWLGSARNWIQSKFHNGENVTWGSGDVLQGREVTVRDIELLAATIAAAAINEYKRG